MKYDKQNNIRTHSYTYTSTCWTITLHIHIFLNSPPHHWLTNWMSRLHTKLKKYKTKYTLYKNICNYTNRKVKFVICCRGYFVFTFKMCVSAWCLILEEFLQYLCYEKPLYCFLHITHFSAQLVENNVRNAKFLSSVSRKTHTD